MLRPGRRKRRPTAAAASDEVSAARALEALKKGLVTAVVVQAEQRPAPGDRQPGDGPGRLTRPASQAEPQTESQGEAGHVVHRVIKIDTIQAGHASPTSDLTVHM